MSAVSVQVLLESILTDTVPTFVDTVSPSAFVMLPSIAPSKVDPFVRFNVNSESSPTRIVPERIWSSALSVAILLSPVHPSAHTERRMLSESALLMLTLERLMTAFVFVTWNT